MRIATFTLIFLLISSASLANTPKAYMDMELSFFAGPPSVFVNGKEVRSGFFTMQRYEISDLMSDNPSALAFAEKHEQHAKWASVSLWGGLAGALAYMAISGADKYRDDVYWGIFGVGFFSAIVLNQYSNAYLMKAINTYNGVDAQKSAQLQFSIQPVREGASLAAKYSF